MMRRIPSHSHQEVSHSLSLWITDKSKEMDSLEGLNTTTTQSTLLNMMRFNLWIHSTPLHPSQLGIPVYGVGEDC